MKTSFAQILQQEARAESARMLRKLPQWAGCPGVTFPTRLATEQCSSSATALYKASLVKRIFAENGISRGRVADLTGGLGVDSWAFSTVAASVRYNEMNPVLADAARANFAALGVQNIDISCCRVEPGNAVDLTGNDTNLVFADPARRGEGGRKVFLLEDCEPDILTLRDELLSLSPHLLVKLSPMADISMVVSRLGAQVREVHVVGTGGASGECKELLVWLQRGWDGPWTLVVADASSSEEGCVCGTIDCGGAGEGSLAVAQAGDIVPGMVLLEPSSTLMKAGCFALLSSRWGLLALDRSTHLFVCPGEVPQLLRDYCKVFIVNEILPLSSASVKSLAVRRMKAGASARNVQMTSSELARRLKLSDGGDVHVFGCATAASGNLLLVCQRVTLF